MKKVLIVCLGNICRSPTAEAVLKARAKELGIDLLVDSAGTIGHHEGNPPDKRSMQAGEKRGYSFKGIFSRKVRSSDFSDEFIPQAPAFTDPIDEVPEPTLDEAPAPIPPLSTINMKWVK